MNASTLAPDAPIQWRAAGAAILSISVVGVTIGLGLPLLSIVLESRGYSATMIGLNSAIAGVSSIITCPFATRIAARLGVAQALTFSILCVAAAMTGFYLFESFGTWLILRLLLGFGLTMVFILSEFWINTTAPPSKRGLVLGIYATCLSLGYAAGPALLSVVGSQGLPPFACVIVAALAGLLPVFFAWKESPKLERQQPVAFTPYIFKVPTATCAVLLYGAVETGIYALMPLYGTLSSLSENSTAQLMICLGLGNLLFQIPLGLISDRLSDRRTLLAFLGIVGVLAMCLLPLAAGHWWQMAALLFVWGGMVTGLYTVGLAHLGSKLAGNELASANSAFILCYSIGMMLGPQMMGIGIDLIGPNGFPAVTGVFFAAYLTLVLMRIAKSQMRA
jgi:MFS family permease